MEIRSGNRLETELWLQAAMERAALGLGQLRNNWPEYVEVADIDNFRELGREPEQIIARLGHCYDHGLQCLGQLLDEVVDSIPVGDSPQELIARGLLEDAACVFDTVASQARNGLFLAVPVAVAVAG